MQRILIGATAGFLAATLACATTARADEKTAPANRHGGGAAPAAAASPAGPMDPADVKKTLYALGVALSKNLSSFNLTPAEVDVVKQGLADGAAGKEEKDIDLTKMGPKFQQLAKERAAVIAAQEKKAGTEYVEKMTKEKGAAKLDSGMVYIEQTAGTGESPKATDRVKVHYHGTLSDGTVFDSSVDRGEPVTFPLNGVIKCWTEGVQKMKVGGKAKIVCPSDLAYGDRGAPPKIKPGATLVFDVQLLGIEPPPTPKPAAATPAAAEKK